MSWAERFYEDHGYDPPDAYFPMVGEVVEVLNDDFEVSHEFDDGQIVKVVDIDVSTLYSPNGIDPVAAEMGGYCGDCNVLCEALEADEDGDRAQWWVHVREIKPVKFTLEG